jgi:hypothetical protein
MPEENNNQTENAKKLEPQAGNAADETAPVLLSAEAFSRAATPEFVWVNRAAACFSRADDRRRYPLRLFRRLR